jgi:CBS domain-containing protein
MSEGSPESRREGPAFAFSAARVRDAMRAPVVSCAPGVGLTQVAELMAAQRMHAIAVVDEGPGGRRLLGLISDLDVVAAAAGEDGPRTAADLARDAPATIAADAALAEAARAMRDGGHHHLVVTGADGEPVGVVSTLDLARALAWGQPPAV